MSDEAPITIPTDFKSLLGYVTVIGGLAFGAAAFKSDLNGIHESIVAIRGYNGAQDERLQKLSDKVDNIPGQLTVLQLQNQRMLDLICEGDGAKNRRGCRMKGDI